MLLELHTGIKIKKILLLRTQMHGLLIFEKLPFENRGMHLFK